ncbi:YlzJ-like family protein [Syntrophomonas curvata]
MIVYVPDPLEAFTPKETLPRIRIKLESGGHLNAECLGFDQVRVLSLDSTDPMDFVNRQYQPGSIIELKPGL